MNRQRPASAARIPGELPTAFYVGPRTDGRRDRVPRTLDHWHDVSMTWGFQLVARLPPENGISGPSPQVWGLPAPVGEVTLTIVAINPASGGGSDLQFRAGQFASEGDAQNAGQSLRDCLRVVTALDGSGLDVGRDRQVSAIGAGVRPQFDERAKREGHFLVEDVHGLVVYEEEPGLEPLRVSLRAAASVQRASEGVRDLVIRAAGAGPWTYKQLLASDLVALADRESWDGARLVTLATAAEVLAERKERTGLARTLVEQFVVHAEKALEASTNESEKRDLQGLVAAVKDLRQSSISASIRDLARDTRPQDPEAPKLANRAYTSRSQLVHTGESSTDPASLWPGLLELIREAIQRR